MYTYRTISVCTIRTRYRLTYTQIGLINTIHIGLHKPIICWDSRRKPSSQADFPTPDILLPAEAFITGRFPDAWNFARLLSLSAEAFITGRIPDAYHFASDGSLHHRQISPLPDILLVCRNSRRKPSSLADFSTPGISLVCRDSWRKPSSQASSLADFSTPDNLLPAEAISRRLTFARLPRLSAEAFITGRILDIRHFGRPRRKPSKQADFPTPDILFVYRDSRG